MSPRFSLDAGEPRANRSKIARRRSAQHLLCCAAYMGCRGLCTIGIRRTTVFFNRHVSLKNLTSSAPRQDYKISFAGRYGINPGAKIQRPISSRSMLIEFSAEHAELKIIHVDQATHRPGDGSVER